MAVPASFTCAKFSGKFILNNSLSDSMDAILEGQGVGWLKRKAVNAVTLTISMMHYTDDAGVEHIAVGQSVKGGGAQDKTEERVLDWKEYPGESPLLGHVVWRARRAQVFELDSEFLKKGWTVDTVEHGLVQLQVQSDTPKSGATWTTVQCWGIEEVKGERRHTRHLKFTGPKGKEVEARLVYDYVGPQ